MKNAVLWLLTLTLIISCISCRRSQTDDLQDGTVSVLETVTSYPETSDTEPDSAAETAAPQTSIRYRRQYSVTELTDELPDALIKGRTLLSHANTGYYDGMLYSFSLSGENVKLHTFSTDGTVGEAASIPVPQGMYLMYAAPCGDGFYLLGGKIAGQYTICIVHADGTVAAQDRIDDLYRFSDPDFYIHKTEDGSTAILVNYYRQVTCQYLFDGETLTRGATIDTSSNPVKNGGTLYLGDGIYISLSFADSGTRLSVDEGQAQPYSLRIPSKNTLWRVCYDAAGAIYLEDSSEGIFQYRDNAMASKVLNWIDVDVPQGSGLSGQNTVWILDENTVFVAHPDTIKGTEGVRLFHVKSALVPDTDERTVIEIRCYEHRDEWLQRAVRSFNAANETYRAEVTFRTGYTIYEQNEDLQQTLLYENRPDLCITSANTDLNMFYDKGAFCDLLPRYEDVLLDCVKDARQFLGALYTIPMRMHIETFACPADVCGDMLTWTKLRKIASSLTDDARLYTSTVSHQTEQHIFNNALLDYVSFKNAFSFYDTNEFREMIQFSRIMENYKSEHYGYLLKDDIKTAGRYGITVPVLNSLFTDGRMKFLTVQLDTIEAVMAASILLGENFNWCGYPSEDGGGAYIYPDLNCSVFADTDMYDGCIAFIDHLLSTTLQTDDTLTERYLPVTVSSIRDVISTHRYWYYNQNEYDAIGNPNARMTIGGTLLGGTFEYLPVSAVGYSADYQDDFGPDGKTEGNFAVLELTDDIGTSFLDFLENCRMKANTDQTIRSIAEEELSYWEGGVRSLEETTAIIDSRVWIYLNE